MSEIDSSSKQQNQSPATVLSNKSVESVDTQTELPNQVEEKVRQSEEVLQPEKSPSLSEPQKEIEKIVVEESSEKKPLKSPPRKSARLSAKRRDSATDSDVSITTRTESPIPKRRSLRRNSISLQDTTSANSKEEPVSNKLPTIIETDKTVANAKQTSENELQKSEKELVDELAAAFVGDFINDEE